MTVGDLKEALQAYPDDAAVCGTIYGTQPLMRLIGSGSTGEEIVVVALRLAGKEDSVDVDFDPIDG